MFAVSTCWKSAEATSGDDIIGPILDAGARAVELEYRITEKIFAEMLPALRKEQPRVVSVHNFFPLPGGLKRDQASGDAFLLSSPEKEERERAVKYTLRTLEHAHEVGAAAVVLHMGRTEVDDGFDELKKKLEDGALGSRSGRANLYSFVKERAKAGGGYLDAALFSLDRLWRTAERFGIRLGVENRYRLKEVPTADELTSILERFEGSIVGYWHDVGHASVQETLYGLQHKDWLLRFSKSLIGVHLHDAEGVADHKAPGKGKIDFEMVREFLSPETIRVIEASPRVTNEELEEGIDFLSERGLL